jgi:hypothetical protein
MKYISVVLLGILLCGCSSSRSSNQKSTDILSTVSTPIQVLASLLPKWTATPNNASPLIDHTDSPADMGERYFETAGKFSFVPPSGWEMVEISGLKYKVARGTQEGNFSPNLNFIDEKFSGSLDDYTAASIAYMKKGFPKMSCTEPREFMTASGIRSNKLVCQNSQNGKDLAQIFYILDDINRKIVATYTRAANSGQKYDSQIDQSMKTFRLEN